jgi:hypothetical protein
MNVSGQNLVAGAFQQFEVGRSGKPVQNGRGASEMGIGAQKWRQPNHPPSSTIAWSMYVKVGGKPVPRKVLAALWKSLEMPVKPTLPSNAVGSEIVIPDFSTEKSAGWIHFLATNFKN